MSDKMYEKPSSDIKATFPEQQAKEEEQESYANSKRI